MELTVDGDVAEEEGLLDTDIEAEGLYCAGVAPRTEARTAASVPGLLESPK